MPGGGTVKCRDFAPFETVTKADILMDRKLQPQVTTTLLIVPYTADTRGCQRVHSSRHYIVAGYIQVYWLCTQGLNLLFLHVERKH